MELDISQGDVWDGLFERFQYDICRCCQVEGRHIAMRATHSNNPDGTSLELDLVVLNQVVNSNVVGLQILMRVSLSQVLRLNWPLFLTNKMLWLMPNTPCGPSKIARRRSVCTLHSETFGKSLRTDRVLMFGTATFSARKNRCVTTSHH